MFKKDEKSQNWKVCKGATRRNDIQRQESNIRKVLISVFSLTVKDFSLLFHVCSTFFVTSLCVSFASIQVYVFFCTFSKTNLICAHFVRHHNLLLHSTPSPPREGTRTEVLKEPSENRKKSLFFQSYKVSFSSCCLCMFTSLIFVCEP